MVLEHGHARLLGRQGHGVGRHPVLFLEYLRYGLAAQVDVRPYALDHLLRNAVDERIHFRSIGGVVAEDGHLTPIQAGVRRVRVGDERQQGANLLVSRKGKLDLAGGVDVEESDFGIELVLHPGDGTVALVLEEDLVIIADQVVGPHEQAAFLLGRRLEMSVETIVRVIHLALLT